MKKQSDVIAPILDTFSEYPRISIVTPNYNQGQFIEATIQSVLSQRYPNLEYIIIDGGSTDESVNVIQKYEQHLHYWCSEPDDGQYDAINKGFAHATGEIMAWLNSDDMYYPWTFLTVASVMKSLQQVQCLTSLSQGHWDYHGYNIGFSSLPGCSREAFLDGCYLHGSKKFIGWIQQESTFWRRDLWLKLGGICSDYKLAGDFDLWSKIFSYSEIYGLDIPLGGFRLRQGQRASLYYEEYHSEATESLSQFRKVFGYEPNLLRVVFQFLKVPNIPKMRSTFRTAYGYIGKKIVRSQPSLPQSNWEIEEYLFY